MSSKDLGMAKVLPRQVDTVIVGTGPSALILSYILHGHIPVYDHNSPHPDSILHEKLKQYKNLLEVDIDLLTEHFGASRFSYSTQALPVDVLYDTLIRPLGETDDVENKTCVRWEYDPAKAVPHVVAGNASQAGGQWVDNPVKASWDIGTLSYAGMLSLPGYSYADFHYERYGKQMPFYLRPSRREVTEYFAAYPAKVGIADSIYHDELLAGIRRDSTGFYIASHNVSCDHLILASGIFTSLKPPRPLLQPLTTLPDSTTVSANHPILIVGSGFSAADIIISTAPDQRILHIFKWAPSKSPSPLRACHQHAYPEYAGVYRKMKSAALHASKSGMSTSKRPSARRASSSAFDQTRDWDKSYEGLPNTLITDVKLCEDKTSAIITLQTNTGTTIERRIAGFSYVVGRRGSLQYLNSDLQAEICPKYNSTMGLSSADMRDQANEDLEVADNIFIIGSLTGDTLIRFAYGGCVYAAGKIIESQRRDQDHRSETQSWEYTDATSSRPSVSSCSSTRSSSTSRGTSSSRNTTRSVGPTSSDNSPASVASAYVKPMHGLDGHEQVFGKVEWDGEVDVDLENEEFTLDKLRMVG